ncbi:bifunctional hydroxymethylpyrimidine kinase/phosphomethylpyrimidine kinase [Mycoplasma marinum]|uniref:Bifunctional hydroxymethylpyrimidine kinase/phosphomethylpyrimidine kinase n=1 Tax=Mycoplasma marinum TaxID=1937190 RepID=A0A4R0XU35_9MOLU|nr:bifunctional hydroxymethylpyrimidine kinase/phosphomethylpyrimidine kinase [Mycoplasma marinum]TCG11179.1 bifunctional hydroxymethylpyrimidine kinase/phosphomethylpyrimidine kinase [Mycoplasma marinum]
MKKIVLTIAGSDSSGGAGIQADIKSIEANGSFAMSVITMITSQNSHEIRSVQQIDLNVIEDQIDVLFEDYNIEAIKIGALLNKDVIKLVARKLKEHKGKKIILDPVMISKSKEKLLKDDSVETLRVEFSKITTLITPNIPETEILIGKEINTVEDMIEASFILQKYGYKNVLIKGGHLEGKDMIDILNLEGQKVIKIKNAKIDTKDTHGTGCTLSSAIASIHSRNENLRESVEEAIEYTQVGIKNALRIGKGSGPLNHFVERK